MTSLRKTMLLASTALGIGVAMPAFAQETPGDQTGTPTPAGAGQSAATSTEAPAEPTRPAANRSSDGDIVVTARRVEERLQDVPISIAVFTPAQISDRNIVTANDLATYTPSLSANSRFGPETATFSIRGFTQENFTTPSVAVYFADVVGPRAQGGTGGGNGGGVGNFFDLQNVQVLRGPQGTLFGRNTTGGAVLLVPQKPTSQFEGYVEGSLGNYDMRRLQGVINVPVGENVRLRVGADRQVRDGYLRNRSGIGPRDFNDIDYFALRGSLVIDLTPNLENYTIASYNETDANGPMVRVFATNTGPNCAPAGAGATGLVGPLVCSQMIPRQIARGDGYYDVENSQPDPRFRTKQTQVINTTTWQASDQLTIKNIASYARFTQLQRGNIFGVNLVVPPTLGPLGGRPFSYVDLTTDPDRNNIEQQTFTEELQFQGRVGEDTLVYQFGAYYEKSKPLGGEYQGTYSPILLSCTDARSLQCIDVFGTAVGRPTAGFLQNSLTRYWFRNIGFYGQATYKFNEWIALTGGIRYTIDKVTSDGATRRILFLTPNVPTFTCSNDPRIPGAIDPEVCNVRLRQKSEKPTWLINLDVHPAEDLLLYAKWARGYRQGSVNSSNSVPNVWGPEKVDAYEVGLKASFSGAVPGYVNFAAFYNDLQDQQLNASLIPLPGFAVSPAQGIVNAGKSRIQGIEVDAQVSPLDGLRLNAGYAYLDSKLKSYVAPPASAFPGYSVVAGSELGDPLPLTPKHRFTGTVNYTLPLDESVGRITFGATYTYTSEQQQWPDSATPFGTLEANDTLNLNVNWNGIAGSPVDLSLFATNVTKEKYFTNIGNGWNTAGYEYATLGQPRMYGARLRVRFGD